MTNTFVSYANTPTLSIWPFFKLLIYGRELLQDGREQLQSGLHQVQCGRECLLHRAELMQCGAE